MSIELIVKKAKAAGNPLSLLQVFVEAAVANSTLTDKEELAQIVWKMYGDCVSLNGFNHPTCLTLLAMYLDLMRCITGTDFGGDRHLQMLERSLKAEMLK